MLVPPPVIAAHRGTWSTRPISPNSFISLVYFSPVTHPATVLDALWVVMRPVDQASEVVPFVHATDLDTVAHANWHASGEINVVRYEQCPATTNVNDEALMA